MGVVSEHVPAYHDIVLRVCRESGFVPNSPHEADHLQLILAMVAEGSGVALVPASARKIKQHRLAFTAVRPALPVLEVGLAWRRDNPSQLVKEFLKTAHEVMSASS